jgi:hypothetical protein
MQKWGVTVHAVEWAISVFSPKISTRTDFSLPTVKRHPLFRLSRFVGEKTFPPHFDASQPQVFMAFLLSLRHCHTSADILPFPYCCDHIGDKPSRLSSMSFGTVCRGLQV